MSTTLEALTTNNNQTNVKLMNSIVDIITYNRMLGNVSLALSTLRNTFSISFTVYFIEIKVCIAQLKVKESVISLPGFTWSDHFIKNAGISLLHTLDIKSVLTANQILFNRTRTRLLCNI